MNEHQLRRLFRRLVLLSAPLPLAVLGAACGGSSTSDIMDGGASSAGGTDGAGSPGAGTSSGGSSAGSSRGGSSAGGSSAGGSSAGHAGAAGSSAGSGGVPSDCKAAPENAACMPVYSTLLRKCLTDAQPVVGAQLPPAACSVFCNATFGPCSVSDVDASTVTVLCQPGCAVGRRPAGLADVSGCDSRAAGSYFAEIAHLEAASVTAFRILRDELRAHGAPKKLVRAAGRAARDEIRHTRATSALARRFGAAPRAPSLEQSKERSVEAIAIENAIEGCVRETYGALLAPRQAEQARDPVVRAAMLRIARDETRHSALAWRVARFLDTKLSPQARCKVADARHSAARELLSSLASEPTVSFAELAGLPPPAEAVQLAEAMQHALWS